MADAYRLQTPAGMDGVALLSGEVRDPTPMAHMHDGFAVGIADLGGWLARYRGVEHAIAPGVMQLATPGEHSRCAFDAAPRRFRVLTADKALVGSLARGLWGDRVADEAVSFTPHALRDDVLSHAMDAVDQALTGGSALAQASAVQAILTLALRRHGAAPRRVTAARDAPSQGVARARQRLDDDPAGNPSLAELAALAGLTPWHFSRQFRRLTGLPPHAYQLHRRVEAAKSRLAAGEDPRQVGLALGFYDQSHFIRHFRRRTGLTPGLYSRAARWKQQ